MERVLPLSNGLLAVAEDGDDVALGSNSGVTFLYFFAKGESGIHGEDSVVLPCHLLGNGSAEGVSDDGRFLFLVLEFGFLQGFLGGLVSFGRFQIAHCKGDVGQPILGIMSPGDRHHDLSLGWIKVDLVPMVGQLLVFFPPGLLESGGGVLVAVGCFETREESRLFGGWRRRSLDGSGAGNRWCVVHGKERKKEAEKVVFITTQIKINAVFATMNHFLEKVASPTHFLEKLPAMAARHIMGKVVQGAVNHIPQYVARTIRKRTFERIEK